MVTSADADRAAPAARFAVPSRGAAVAAVLPPVAVAVVVGILSGMRAEPWRDEYATAAFALLDPGDLAAAAAHVDAVLAPYYLLMHLVVPGFGITGARIVSLLALGATAGLVAAVALRWWGRGPALISGLAVALNPVLVGFGVQARPTALAVCAVALAVLVLDVALTGRRWAWWVFVIAATFAVLMQLFAVIAVVVTGLLPVGRGRRAKLRGAAASLPAVLVAGLLLAVGWGQREQVAWIPRPSPRAAILALADVTGTAVPHAASLDFVVLALLVAGMAVTVLSARLLRPPVVAFSITLLVVPWSLLLIASWLTVPVFVPRYFAAVGLGAALIVGALVRVAQRSDRRIVRSAAAIVVAVLLVTGTSATVGRIRHPAPSVDGYGTIAGILREQAQPGDLLVVAQAFGEGGLAYGLAEATADDRYASQLRARLASGDQPPLELRRIVSVRPWRTESVVGGATGGAAVWLFGLERPSQDRLTELDPAVATCIRSQGDVAALPTDGDVLVRFQGCSGP
ncbi:hypothetical protein LK09_03230 [Microbacterium mangrovi]|uniref:Glycosyltransferase RgtA/B/C/D-like domain-containing protein n=1 Tax=Microbacterium mangrovi TaxID=1348253 RepID=A0A0B2AC48_9MICO|nr:glycosyltransferase family 39 protein [Microbacterium mangrovi]KHK99308.1 hypothetical protein LK09_03230 [Microbacterium mangrovi]